MWFDQLLKGNDHRNILLSVRIWLEEYNQDWLRHIEGDGSRKNMRTAIKVFLQYYNGGKYYVHI